MTFVCVLPCVVSGSGPDIPLASNLGRPALVFLCSGLCSLYRHVTREHLSFTSRGVSPTLREGKYHIKKERKREREIIEDLLWKRIVSAKICWFNFFTKNILYRPTYENSGSNTIVENQYKLPRIETDTFCIITKFLLARAILYGEKKNKLVDCGT